MYLHFVFRNRCVFLLGIGKNKGVSGLGWRLVGVCANVDGYQIWEGEEEVRGHNTAQPLPAGRN